MPFPLDPIPQNRSGANYLMRGSIPQLCPQDMEMLSHSPGISVTWRPPLLITQKLPWKDPCSRWSKFTDHLLPRLSKEILPSARVENKTPWQPPTLQLGLTCSRCLHRIEALGPDHSHSRHNLPGHPTATEERTRGGDRHLVISH